MITKMQSLTDNIANLEAQLGKLKSEREQLVQNLAQTNAKLVSDKVEVIKGLIKECEALSDEAGLTFSLGIDVYPRIKYVGTGSTESYDNQFDYEESKSTKEKGGWESSAGRC